MSSTADGKIHVSVNGGGGIGSAGSTSSAALLPHDKQQELNDLYAKIHAITGGSNSPYQQVTQEELVELSALEEQHRRDLTQQQVEAFKRVPAVIRQRVVDDIMWNRELVSIENVAVEKTQRQVELETKKHSLQLPNSISGYITSISTTSTIVPYPYSYPINTARTVIPSRMSEDDIIRAHNEQTMEEECLSQK